MGVIHGAICVGCCWALMALMFVFGAMNLIWMAALGARDAFGEDGAPSALTSPGRWLGVVLMLARRGVGDPSAATRRAGERLGRKRLNG